MSGFCFECGAPVSDASDCQQHFHALLALEWQIPGGPGALAHFFAVATYGLQHPTGMNYTADTIHGLRRAVGDALSGSVTVDALRHRVADAVRVPGRVTRRAGDAEVRWPVPTWPMTVADVLTVDLDQTAYFARVSAWATSVLRTLDDAGL